MHYFEAMSKLLIADKTLFCVSAWNDNGKEEVIEKDPGWINGFKIDREI